MLSLFLVGIRDVVFIPRGHLSLLRDAFDNNIKGLLLAPRLMLKTLQSSARG